MPIRVLPQTLINQIAAGEVIVRMASVVKEMVENSIDAGAAGIEILVENNCRDVEVRDDGSGMDREDAELCLQRHATSKISTVEDLFSLRTRGFRGEAVPSIASVSRMEIQTRRRDVLSGTRLVVEGGRIERIEAVGCPPGTRIQVRDLFYNTPARLKFLKTPASEMNALLSTVMRQAMAQPGVGIRVERDGREVLDVPPGQSLAERFRSLLGSQLKGELLPLNFERGTTRIDGILAHPHDARGDRRSQFFFVNGRPFASKQLGAAMEQACRGYVMIGRFPIACVFIEVPPEEVDFNVHPTKDEVRFRNERSIAGAVYRAVQQALEGSPALVGEVKLDEQNGIETEAREAPAKHDGPSIQPPPGPPGFFKTPEQLIRRAFERKQDRQRSQGDLLVEADKRARREAPAPEKSLRLSVGRHGDGSAIAAGPGEKPDYGFWERGYEPEPLGQIAATYILVRFGDELLIVDQHASHERLVYIHLKHRTRRIDSQALMIPITMELDPAQSEALRGMVPHFERMGFEVSEFGRRTWAVNSVPADLPEFDPVPLIIESIGDMEEARRINALDDLYDKILIRTACHGAIRAGDILSMDRMKGLMAEIKAERLSFTCPHGRPTIVRLSKAELDKQFKRIV